MCRRRNWRWLENIGLWDGDVGQHWVSSKHRITCQSMHSWKWVTIHAVYGGDGACWVIQKCCNMNCVYLCLFLCLLPSHTEPIYMVVEYMCHGDLLGFLRASRGIHNMYSISPGTRYHPPTLNLCSRDIVNFATKIANGMRYLADRKVCRQTSCLNWKKFTCIVDIIITWVWLCLLMHSDCTSCTLC